MIVQKQLLVLCHLQFLHQLSRFADTTIAMVNEKGFSLVELAIAAAIAAALAVVAVSVTSGTVSSVSDKAQEAAWVEECGMQDMVAELEVSLSICTIENWQGRQEYYANKNNSN